VQTVNEDLERIVAERTTELNRSNEQLQLQLAHRLQVEEARQKEQEFLGAILQTMDDGIAACNASGVLTHLNRAAREFHGFTEEPWPAEEWAERFAVYLPDGKTPMKTEELPLVRALRGERVRNEEVVIRPKQGAMRRLLISGQAMHGQNGEKLGAVVVYRDITELKQLEQQVIHAQKMEALGRLAGGVAHDFNNLLTIINGYSQLLLERVEPQGPVHDQLDQILKAGERAASLTRQLLAFSRKQILQPQVVDLNAVVSDTDKMLRRLIGEEIELSTVLRPDLGRVKVDPAQIEQVIMNLAINARDAMPRGGKLTIETANVDLDEAYARAHTEVRPGAYVMLALSDNGCGMDAETQARIFEPFFTTKEIGNGTGLGLSTVYGIIKQTGGHVSVYSEVGRGTTFKVYLPRLDKPVELAEEIKAQGADPSGTETILVVEDEAGVRMLIQSILESHGYTVILAGSPVEAATLSEKHTGRIHLLLTDVVMPSFSGKELADHLTFSRPDMKVLFISGYTADAIVHHRVLDAGTQFLQKPFTPNALLRKVRETIDKPSQ
jgi:PAS domain S-box-containing protein